MPNLPNPTPMRTRFAQALNPPVRSPVPVPMSALKPRQGVLETMEEERQRPAAMAAWQQSLRMPSAMREAVQRGLISGDIGIANRAQMALNALPSTLAPTLRNVDTGIAAQLQLQSQARQEAEQQRRQQQRQAYSEAAARNLERAHAGGYLGMPGVQTGTVNGRRIVFGPGLQQMGLPQIAPRSAMRQRFAAALQQVPSAALEPLALRGHPLAARMLPGVRDREAAQAQNLADIRYVQPAQIRANAQAYTADQRGNLKRMELTNSLGQPTPAATRAWSDSNKRRVEEGLPEIPWGRWVQTQMQGTQMAQPQPQTQAQPQPQAQVQPQQEAQVQDLPPEMRERFSKLPGDKQARMLRFLKLPKDQQARMLKKLRNG